MHDDRDLVRAIADACRGRFETSPYRDAEACRTASAVQPLKVLPLSAIVAKTGDVEPAKRSPTRFERINQTLNHRGVRSKGCLMPKGLDQNPWARPRMPRVMMREG